MVIINLVDLLLAAVWLQTLLLSLEINSPHPDELCVGRDPRHQEHPEHGLPGHKT